MEEGRGGLGEYPLGAGGQTVFDPVGPSGCDRYIAKLEWPVLSGKKSGTAEVFAFVSLWDEGVLFF